MPAQARTRDGPPASPPCTRDVLPPVPAPVITESKSECEPSAAIPAEYWRRCSWRRRAGLLRRTSFSGTVLSPWCISWSRRYSRRRNDGLRPVSSQIRGIFGCGQPSCRATGASKAWRPGHRLFPLSDVARSCHAR